MVGGPDDENSTKRIQTLVIQFCGEKKRSPVLPVYHKMAAMTMFLLPPTVQEKCLTGLPQFHPRELLKGLK